MGNYLNTIDGTLVNNSAAAVHSVRETDMEGELMNLPLPSEPESAGDQLQH